MDLVARMGYRWYTRVTPESCFETAQPRIRGIGYDALPYTLLHSTVLSANDLGKLAGVLSTPEADPNFDLNHFVTQPQQHVRSEVWERIRNYIRSLQEDSGNVITQRHQLAHEFLSLDLLNEAWQILLPGLEG
jgi:hypothetical protein